MTPRAPSLSPDDRRAHLIDRTLDLLRERGNLVTTKEIAAAAEVAEGTIFRAFATKDELITAALRQAFDPTSYLRAITTLPTDIGLREHLIQSVGLMQARFVQTHDLMAAMGMVTIPDDLVGGPGEQRARRARVEEILTGHAETYRDELRVSPRELIRLVRLLAFSGSHPQLTHGEVLRVDHMVDTILYGVAIGRPHCAAGDMDAPC